MRLTGGRDPLGDGGAAAEVTTTIQRGLAQQTKGTQVWGARLAGASVGALLFAAACLAAWLLVPWDSLTNETVLILGVMAVTFVGIACMGVGAWVTGIVARKQLERRIKAQVRRYRVLPGDETAESAEAADRLRRMLDDDS